MANEGAVGGLMGAALIVAVSIIALTIMSNVGQSLYDANKAPNSTAAGWVAYAAGNVSGQGLFGLREIGLWMPTIALVVAAGAIIAILIGAFAFGNR